MMTTAPIFNSSNNANSFVNNNNSSINAHANNNANTNTNTNTNNNSLFYFPPHPYEVTYQCASCYDSYKKMIVGNAWYSLDKHECPHCHVFQIPSIDIDSPDNARELDPTTSFLYYPDDDEESPLEEVAFTSEDEEFFTLDLLSDEILFAISQRPSILLKHQVNGEVLSRLIGLAEKVDLRCLALIEHSKHCGVGVCYDYCCASSTNSSAFANPWMGNGNLLCLPTTTTTTSSPPSPSHYSSASSDSMISSSSNPPKNGFHPTSRQEKLCKITKDLLNHARTCTNHVCHVDHCDEFRVILQYQQLFRLSPFVNAALLQ